ncbi:winged helix-turn-helix transcriptional regulator [Hymenobacter terrenus]|uniref:winged helix-turn-helix transcriptional regulator n=1 Tax=Hymenobacter terrenus TaxID=1629124 RepID=UPI0006196BED|nr:helix-turn-helix domain-containing protein [Hymenobacter terrenus]
MTTPDRYAPLSKFLAAVKGKYKLPILIYLKHGPKRYSQVYRRLAGVSERILSKQLRELEQEGILLKTVTGTKAPLRVEYALTAHGFTLCAVVQQMWEWGERTLEKEAAQG